MPSNRKNPIQWLVVRKPSIGQQTVVFEQASVVGLIMAAAIASTSVAWYGIFSAASEK
jgi:hypothetical protein